MNDRPVSPRRTRRLGLLATALSATLTPAGKIVAGATATAILLGGLVVGSHLADPVGAPPAKPKATPGNVHPIAAHTEPYLIAIEHDGQALPIALVEDKPASNVATLESAAELPFGTLPGSVSMPNRPSRRVVAMAPLPSAILPGSAHVPGPSAPPAAHPPAPFPTAHAPAGFAPANNAPSGTAPPDDPNSEGDVPGAPDNTPEHTPDTTPAGEPPSSEEPLPANPLQPDLPAQLLPDNPEVPQVPDSGPARSTAAQPAAVPEPSILGLLLLGSLAMLVASRRRTAARRA